MQDRHLARYGPGFLLIVRLACGLILASLLWLPFHLSQRIFGVRRAATVPRPFLEFRCGFVDNADLAKRQVRRNGAETIRTHTNL